MEKCSCVSTVTQINTVVYTKILRLRLEVTLQIFLAPAKQFASRRTNCD